MATQFVDWLETQCAAVAMLEAAGRQHLARNDTDGYRDAMRRKATLLAALADDAPDATPQWVRERLERFASSARTALSLHSVFYMSALLFPEDYKDGQPNDLELFHRSLLEKK